MARVFLSHSSHDREEASALRQWLIEQGFEAPFLDFDSSTGIAPGENWEQILYRELERSQAILLLLTAAWQASKWCFAEFTQARALGKPVLPVIAGPLREDAGTLPSDVQAVNLLTDRDDSLDRLRRQLAAIALTSQGGVPWDGLRPPYPGLAPLEEEDAAVYFGREPEIRRIVERLTARRSLGGSALLVVLGASGAGKSSLLRAGVVPRLRRTGRQWIAPPPFRPQSKPVDSFALSLASALGNSGGWRALSDRLRDALQYGTQHTLLADLANDLRQASNANDASILIAIDQGEELFQHSDPQERHVFLHLLSAALGEDLPYIGLMVIRSDGLAALQGEDRLAVALEQLSLAPLPLERLEEVIRGPARVAGLRVEAALTRNILRDATSGEALPLLAFTLRELHDRSAPVHHLTASAYEALGDPRLGLSPLDNAVRAAADRALAMLRPDDAQLAALRDAFVPHMVRVTESGDYGRRPANWQAVPATAHPMLEALIAARVLTLREERGERIVEVAHEALLRKWPLLRRWLDEDRQCLLDLQHWQLAEREWSEAKPEDKDGLLLSGLKLTRARSWLQERPRDIPATVRAFVETSMAKADAQQLRALARRRAVITALSALTGLALLTSAAALWQLREAQRAQALQFRSLAVALLEASPVESMINALAGIDRQDIKKATMDFTDHHLLTVLSLGLAGNSAVSRFPVAQQSTALLRIAADQYILAERNGTLLRWRPGASAAQPLPEGHANVRALALSPTGPWISASGDGTLRRWQGSHPMGAAVDGGQRHLVSLAALAHGEAVTGALDGSLRWWREGQPAGPLQRTGLGAIWALHALPDGSVLVGGDRGLVQRWTPAGAASAAVKSGQGSVRRLAVLSDGSWLSGGEDGTVRRWRNGRPQERIGPRVFGSIQTLTALPGQQVAWSVDSGGLVLWRDGRPPRAIQIEGGVPLLEVQPASGEMFLSLSNAGELARWEWPRPVPWLRDSEQQAVHALLVKRDGTLISGGMDGTLRQWRDLRPLAAPLQTRQGPVRILQELHRGALIVGGLDATLQVWDRGRPRGKPIPTAQVGLRSLLVLRNGDLLSGGYDGRQGLWRGLRHLKPILVNGDAPVLSLAELPNGDVLTGDANGLLRRLRWPSWQGPGTSTGHSAILSILPLSNRDWLTAGRDGTLRRWRDGQPIGPVLKVVEANRSWRIAMLPSRDLVVSSDGKGGFLRKLVPPAVVIQEACLRLGDLPELRSPRTAAEKAAASLCKAAA
jgi:WD40 repeat protein